MKAVTVTVLYTTIEVRKEVLRKNYESLLVKSYLSSYFVFSYFSNFLPVTFGSNAAIISDSHSISSMEKNYIVSFNLLLNLAKKKTGLEIVSRAVYESVLECADSWQQFQQLIVVSPDVRKTYP